MGLQCFTNDYNMFDSYIPFINKGNYGKKDEAHIIKRIPRVSNEMCILICFGFTLPHVH